MVCECLSTETTPRCVTAGTGADASGGHVRATHHGLLPALPRRGEPVHPEPAVALLGAGVVPGAIARAPARRRRHQGQRVGRLSA